MSVLAIYTHQLTRLIGGQYLLNRVTMTVAQRSILGLVGAQGAGKTTLLQVLSGRLLPTSGVAQILGYDMWTESEAIRSHTLLIRASSPAVPPRPCRELLADIEAAITGRSLVLLDEPVVDVHSCVEADFYRRLEAIVSNHSATLVITSEHLDALEPICHHIGVLCMGELLAVVPTREARSRCATCVEIRGRGFTPALIALLHRRSSVFVVAATASYLRIILLGTLRGHPTERDDSAPLVTLLIESGAEVEEVYRRPIGFAELSTCAVGVGVSSIP